MLTRTIALLALVLGVATAVVSPVSAQTSGSDSLKKLEADLKKLQAHLKELEGKLSKAGEKTEPKTPFRSREGSFAKPDKEKMAEMFKKWSEWKKAGKGPPPWAGKGWAFARPDPEKFKEYMKKKGGDWKKKEAGKGPHPSAGKYKGKAKGRHMAHRRHGRPGASSRHVEARIDHIIKELEDLRKQLKKR